jgi:hypothetical protein
MEERRTTGRDEDYRELKEVLSPAGVAWGSAMHGMLRHWRGGGEVDPSATSAERFRHWGPAVIEAGKAIEVRARGV